MIRNVSPFPCHRTLLGSAALCATALLHGGTAHAYAWVQPKGHGIVIVQEDRWSGHSGFGSRHNLYRFPDNGNSYVNQTNVYVEYGLTRKLTLTGSFWLNQIGYENAYRKNENFGFGDQELGARYKMKPLGFLGAPWVGASQLSVGFPTWRDRRTVC